VTVELREFIEQRITEDERAACIDGPSPRPWVAVTDADSGPCVRTGVDQEPEWQREVNHQVWHCDDEADGCPEQARMWISEAEHMARHDPARVLRDVEAKRRLLAQYQAVCDEVRSPKSAEHRMNARARQFALDEVLVTLALPFSDHTDYNPSWSPS
jgi:hypothetical protein